MYEAYNPADARDWILKKLERKPFRAVEEKLSSMLDDFIRYDLHYMRVSGVLDPNDDPGDNEYDDDDAFEFIYDAYLSDHPDDEDDDMLAATLLDQYMELHQEYLALMGFLS
ncbi:MAG: hypothetical protein E7331_00035 [Clostridiales bacterium]|nr:hypothetical protein [Clostridiales bacterium]